ncbi:MAG: phosphoglycolate phosphatase [Nanoarchaeota archaeon]|nr:phosphoglycolate phosphatase [Nanoarchaeota archaeon]
MKIYFASQSFYPHIGGVSTYLLNLAKELKARGNEVIELHLRPSHAPSNEVIEKIDIIRVPREPLDRKMLKGYAKFKEAIYKESHGLGGFSRTPIEMEGYDDYVQINEAFGQEVRELLNKDPADVINIHDFQLLYLYKYVPRGTPLVLTWHIPLAKSMSTPLKKYLVKHLNMYDKVVFSSPEYIEAAIRMGIKREKCELIHPICNTNIFKKMDVDREAVLKRYKIPVGSKTVMSVQRIDPKSGHEQLIKAWSAVMRAVAGAKLVFVGGQSMSNKLSKDRQVYQDRVMAMIAKSGLKEDIIFTGNIDYTKLPELYNAVDAIALCSQNEGFGLSVTEGMSCGRPIIGTNVGGIPLQVQDKQNGFIVERGDIKATSDSIIRLLKDEKLRRRFGKRSLELVEESFKLDIGVDKYIHLFNSLMREKDEGRCLEKMDADDVNALVTDFDRTITDRPGVLSRNVMKELKKLKTMHILATGRPFEFVKRLARSHRIWDAIVCENGAVVYFPNSKKTIIINSVFMDKARKTLEEKRIAGQYGEVVISLSLDTFEKARPLLAKLSKNLNYVRNVDVMMILPKFVDKGRSVKVVLDYFGIDSDKIIVVGDAENDLDLFRIPGYKVAVANAHPKLKIIADETTENPSSRGVIELVEKLLRK